MTSKYSLVCPLVKSNLNIPLQFVFQLEEVMLHIIETAYRHLSPHYIYKKEGNEKKKGDF